MNNVAGEWVSDRGSGAERFDGSGDTMALAGDKPQRYTSLFRLSAVAARAMVVGVVGRAWRRVTLRLGT